MSLYNMIFGVNPFAGVLLGLLELQHADVPRFRDCYAKGDRIAIYTRTGGGNRDYYDSPEARLGNYGADEPSAGPFNSDLRAHPWYESDEDDDFDCTYATFYFNPPWTVKAAMACLPAGDVDREEAWKDFFEKLREGDETDPHVKAARERVEPMLREALGGLWGAEPTPPEG